MCGKTVRPGGRAREKEQRDESRGMEEVRVASQAQLLHSKRPVFKDFPLLRGSRVEVFISKIFWSSLQWKV